MGRTVNNATSDLTLKLGILAKYLVAGVPRPSSDPERAPLLVKGIHDKVHDAADLRVELQPLVEYSALNLEIQVAGAGAEARLERQKAKSYDGRTCSGVL